jgi:hypothetical protein
MIIRKVAVGNSEEAFIEDTLSEGLNILLSDDNDKGKTIIIQSMLCRRLRIEVNDINRLNRFRNEPIYFFVYIILYWIKFFDIDNGRYKR